ncbi:bifunctional phosphatase PAP2/diacylglycerol kinase family protein [Herbiconiux sp. L3-i23]|uniref:bifunctional phosphatase PAP2/diacylglycerol kinase family protein n=1 Tax=Herbiconiux sp. L3-i23 TaxID=2905871 RepID=UPI0020450A79|nr:bifunctional phosphatase PAP2/diacylglycerol kinase family protein [Herbiconiux sp. L3-i23]BDI22485.1 phosphoesterase [Herbiconiux sp. L3-i23]
MRHPVVAYRRARLLPGWVRRLDRRAGRLINARRAHRWRDGGYRRLSRTADHGRLWFAIAGVLFLTGRRRAAIRGVLSLLAASALANLVGKRLFGGPRPLVKHIPLARRLHVYPASASFPSGHSASAAAFATGVTLESPAAGFLVAPLAAGVVYSRLHVGAHWLSDVVAGAALGGAVAVVGRLVAPAQTPSEQPIPGTGEAVELPTLGDGADAFIVMNRKAGKDVLRADPRLQITRRLPAAQVHELRPDETADDAVREAMGSDRPPRVLGVLGGDGSVSRMAHLAREFDLPLLVLPGGTFNHFARAAGVPTVDDSLDAAERGTGVLVSAADLEVDGRSLTVLNTASVGVYPDFVADRKKRKKRLGKWLAGVLAAATVLRSASPVDVEVDGRRIRVWSLFASVGRNEPEQIATMQRRSLDDDVLDVRMLHARGSRLRAITSLAFGRKTSAVLRVLHLLPPRSDVESFTASSVRLGVTSKGRGDVPFAHDGELERPGSDYGAELRVQARALRVYAPPPRRPEGSTLA